ncbi:MAG: DUF1080 domain-containing protein [Bacteroidaceae bacterium]|nr:DUF1080 domain-containing protein [Bacteroidaceae bacterium]
MRRMRKMCASVCLTWTMAMMVSCGSAVPGWQLCGDVDNREGIVVLCPDGKLSSEREVKNFRLSCKILTSKDAEGCIRFHVDGARGYDVLLHNGSIDGSRKTGSLASVRNLYRSLAHDSVWADLEVCVRGQNVTVAVGGTEVVCYTQPAAPYRTEAHAGQLLGKGRVVFATQKGQISVKDLSLEPLADDATNPCDTLPLVDEQSDGIIRLQQMDFPVIDYHVHLKGGLNKEEAHALSMRYGINYGVAPNAGEGGVGRMLANDEEVRAYLQEVQPLPFLCGVQGEGRKWTQTFSQEALGAFDYLFTDAMTIIDSEGRNARIYRPEEVHDNGDMEAYMERIVDQTCLILTNEPADIFANATYIPDAMNDRYEHFWTDERVARVLDVMQRYDIALEINARYRIPSKRVIRQAKERGLKFTFGTNNVDADFGRLEYCVECIRDCGLTPQDMWFPTMSKRAQHPVVIYNDFSKIVMQY